MISDTELLRSVRSIAQRLGLLLPDGDLTRLESLSIVEFVSELEHVLRVEVPTAALNESSFGSLQSVTAMLRPLLARPAVNTP
jgi:hypothetical protein